ncbi:MAG: TIGR01777 family oxidoreductase [Thermoleophilaceae bacterium]
MFRGALAVRAKAIPEAMKLAAARGIAATVADEELAGDYIVPSVFNRDVSLQVARAVAQEAEPGRRHPGDGRDRRALRSRVGSTAREHSRGGQMKVTVTGATGTLGRQVVAELSTRGDEVTVLSRDPDRAREALGPAVRALKWADPKAEAPPAESLEGQDAVVHLLGEPVAQRWSDETKKEIRDSRVLSTRNLVAALRAARPRPPVLVSQSGSGWYGARGEEKVDESEPAGDDFLARVCVEWEAEATKAEQLGLRVVLTRTGVVLSEDGGALEKMLPPFKLGVGGPVAGGRQYVPWVHVDDVVGSMLHCLASKAARGPVNVTAPEPVTNAELSKALGRVLRRPAVAPVPGLAIKALYGEMASIVTTGVRAVPARLQGLDYAFRRSGFEDALHAATGRAR